MSIQFVGLKEINGPLVVLDHVQDASFEEMVHLELEDGSIRDGRIVSLEGDKAVIQVFEGTTGLSLTNTRTRLLGHPMEMALSPEVLGRVFSGSAVEAMKRRTWPGNVRELENAVERAVYMSTGRIIQEEDLGEVFIPQPAPDPEAVRQHSAGAEKSLLEDLMMRYRGNVREAARELGCSKSSLYTKMNRHHIRARDFRILSVPPPAGKKRLSDLSPTQIEKLFKLLGDEDGE